MNLERKCNNCTKNPCTRIECKKDGICEIHMFEHEKIMKLINVDGLNHKFEEVK